GLRGGLATGRDRGNKGRGRTARRRGGARPPERRVRGAFRVPLLRLRRRPAACRAPARDGRGSRRRPGCRAPSRARCGRRHRPRPVCHAAGHGHGCPRGGIGVIELGANRYGKAAIRLVRVVRGADGDRVRDLTVAIALEGDFEAAHTDGDNALVIATDTMKNTAYAFAKDHLDGSIEDYGRALASHFLQEPQVDVATANIRAHHWAAIDVAGTPAPGAFVRGGEGTRLATVSATGAGTSVEAGVED